MQNGIRNLLRGVKISLAGTGYAGRIKGGVMIERDVDTIIDVITGAVLTLALIAGALTIGAQLVIWWRG